MKTPKVTVYDNGGKTYDRYTVVIGKDVFGMSENAWGFNQYCGEVGREVILGKHLGKKLKGIPESIVQAVVNRCKDC